MTAPPHASPRAVAGADTDPRHGVERRVGGAAAADPRVYGAAPVAPLRVAYCLDSMEASGGTELNAVRTAEALDPSRVALTVFAMRPDGPMRARYEACGIPVVATPPVTSLVAPRTLRQAWRLAALFRAYDADVVHCHDVYTNWVAGLAARAAGRPLLTSKRWVGGHPRHLRLSRVAYHLSRRVLANSPNVAHTLVAQDWVPPDRIVVVPNFVEDDAFASIPAPEADRLRSTWGVPAGGPVVGCVARLRAEKGQAVLLRAAARLTDRWPDLVVVLVGDGPEEAALRALAAELGIAGRVCFAGHRPNRPNPHQLFDVSVQASDHEGFPNTVVEAMAAGRPVVASRVGGVPDAVEDGGSGRLVPPRDAAALADAVADVLVDPERAARYGARGRALAWDRYRAGPTLARLTAVYADLAGWRAPSARRNSV